MNFTYTPFPGQTLSQLSAPDLEVLRAVHEGWYVEYKRELPKPADIAKAIAGFANTYGGWLFIGVAEAGKADNVAGACPGISRADMDGALQSIRQSTAGHLNPTPHFDLHVVWGPNEAMDLPADHGVICMEIPQSPFAPHIHSKGVIYRRVADSSEPKPETDRHQLDLMWQRREKIHEDYRAWIEREPELSKGESERPYLRLLLEADLYRAKGQSWDLSVQDIRDTLNDATSGPAAPLEAIYPSAHGITARQTSSLRRHEDFGLTWIIGRGLRCEIWIPINSVSAGDPDHLWADLGKYQHIDRFITMLKAARASDSRILDLNQVFAILHAISNMYLKLLGKAGVNTETVHAKALLGGVWRTIPFLDAPTMLDRIDQSGLPLCLIDAAMVPSGTDADSFFPIKLVGPFAPPNLHQMGCAFYLFELVCRAVGLQGILASHIEDEASALLDELREAWGRSQPETEEQDDR